MWLGIPVARVSVRKYSLPLHASATTEFTVLTYIVRLLAGGMLFSFAIVSARDEIHTCVHVYTYNDNGIYYS